MNSTKFHTMTIGLMLYNVIQAIFNEIWYIFSLIKQKYDDWLFGIVHIFYKKMFLNKKKNNPNFSAKLKVHSFVDLRSICVEKTFKISLHRSQLK